jgi:hypothetical protein
MGFTQGLLAAMVAQPAPADLRGTAFGSSTWRAAGAMLARERARGRAMALRGPAATFWAGAALAAASLALTRLHRR